LIAARRYQQIRRLFRKASEDLTVSDTLPVCLDSPNAMMPEWDEQRALLAFAEGHIAAAITSTTGWHREEFSWLALVSTATCPWL
jgi:hypothetical protein